MIYFDTIRNIDKYVGLCSECWIIVRSLRNQINVSGIKCQQVKELSPSWGLFTEYRRIKELGEWNEDSFNRIYRPRFMSEMKTQLAQSYLKKLRDTSDNIVCVCFCPEEKCCHRGLIKEILKYNGVMVYEPES
jgi:hypothetical protein